MPSLHVDFTEVQDLEDVTPGTYPATVFEASEEESSTGKPMVTIVFKISDGEFEGRKVYNNYLLMPENLWAFKLFLQALGWEKEELGGELHLNTEDLVGKPCRIRVTQREWDGRMVPNVKAVMAATEEDQELASLLG